jgi:hypothetical protein
MDRLSSIEKKLSKVFVPVQPRIAYVKTLKDKLMRDRRMPVEMEQPVDVREAVTMAALGLGAVATIAAVTTIGVKLADLIGSGGILAKAAAPQKRAKMSAV